MWLIRACSLRNPKLKIHKKLQWEDIYIYYEQIPKHCRIEFKNSTSKLMKYLDLNNLNHVDLSHNINELSFDRNFKLKRLNLRAPTLLITNI